jgi:hypothetical protein
VIERVLVQFCALKIGNTIGEFTRIYKFAFVGIFASYYCEISKKLKFLAIL